VENLHTELKSIRKMRPSQSMCTVNTSCSLHFHSGKTCWWCDLVRKQHEWKSVL